MGRIYRANTGTATTNTGAMDIFELNVHSLKAVRLLEIHLSQVSETGDAAEEMIIVTVKEGMSSSGSGGATPTAVPRAKGDAAYAGTVETHNTTPSSTGTIVTHLTTAWNIRVPLDIIFTPETVIELAPSTRLAVNLSAPADVTTFMGYIVFEEIG